MAFIDDYNRIKRGAQIITPKDIAAIIAATCIGKESKIVDAGGGSGALACFLANIAKEVTTYEIRKDFAELVKQNAEKLKLKNIKVKNKDITKGISEKNVDLVTLDFLDSWKALKHAEKALKSGGFIAAYSPSITQNQRFLKEAAKYKTLKQVKTTEIIEREWILDELRARPKNVQLVHTGFLTFLRKTE